MVALSLALLVAASVACAASQIQSGGAAPPAPPGTEASRTLSNPEKRGDDLMSREMYRQAIDAYSASAGREAILLNKIGIAYQQMNMLDLAKEYYERALKVDKSYAEAQNNVGTVHYMKKNYGRAVEEYRKAVQLRPKSASFHMNLGTAYFAQKKEDEAMAEYQTALQLDPNVFETHGNFGVILQARGVEERARYHFSLARLYAKANRDDLALQYLRRALEEGFKDRKKLEEDPAFETLRKMPEFQELLALEPRVL